jgi:hypothetical protein
MIAHQVFVGGAMGNYLYPAQYGGPIGRRVDSADKNHLELGKVIDRCRREAVYRETNSAIAGDQPLARVRAYKAT